MSKLRSSWLSPLLALALFVAPSMARADDEADRITALGKPHTYTVKTTAPASPIETGGAAVVVDAPIADVRKVVTNYGSYQKFLKPFDQSRVLSKRKGVSEVYLQVPILHGAARIWAVTELSPPTKRGAEEVITGKLKRGNVADFRAVWRMRPIGEDRTVLKLELLVDPSLPFGASIITQTLVKSAEKGVKGVKERAEAAYAKRRPADQKAAAAPAPAPAPAPAAPPAKPEGDDQQRAQGDQGGEQAPAEAPKLPEAEGAPAVKQKDVAKR